MCKGLILWTLCCEFAWSSYSVNSSDSKAIWRDFRFEKSYSWVGTGEQRTEKEAKYG